VYITDVLKPSQGSITGTDTYITSYMWWSGETNEVTWWTHPRFLWCWRGDHRVRWLPYNTRTHHFNSNLQGKPQCSRRIPINQQPPISFLHLFQMCVSSKDRPKLLMSSLTQSQQAFLGYHHPSPTDIQCLTKPAQPTILNHLANSHSMLALYNVIKQRINIFYHFAK